MGLCSLRAVKGLSPIVEAIGLDNGLANPHEAATSSSRLAVSNLVIDSLETGFAK